MKLPDVEQRIAFPEVGGVFAWISTGWGNRTYPLSDVSMSLTDRTASASLKVKPGSMFAIGFADLRRPKGFRTTKTAPKRIKESYQIAVWMGGKLLEKHVFDMDDTCFIHPGSHESRYTLISEDYRRRPFSFTGDVDSLTPIKLVFRRVKKLSEPGARQLFSGLRYHELGVDDPSELLDRLDEKQRRNTLKTPQQLGRTQHECRDSLEKPFAVIEFNPLADGYKPPVIKPEPEMVKGDCSDSEPERDWSKAPTRSMLRSPRKTAAPPAAPIRPAAQPPDAAPPSPTHADDWIAIPRYISAGTRNDYLNLTAAYQDGRITSFDHHRYLNLRHKFLGLHIAFETHPATGVSLPGAYASRSPYPPYDRVGPDGHPFPQIAPRAPPGPSRPRAAAASVVQPPPVTAPAASYTTCGPGRPSSSCPSTWNTPAASSSASSASFSTPSTSSTAVTSPCASSSVPPNTQVRRPWLRPSAAFQASAAAEAAAEAAAAASASTSSPSAPAPAPAASSPLSRRKRRLDPAYAAATDLDRKDLLRRQRRAELEEEAHVAALEAELDLLKRQERILRKRKMERERAERERAAGGGQVLGILASQVGRYVV
ncbi:hypothetical protein JCM10207_007472 [Rhodosporidiobolus poonsookiae]